MLTPSRMLMPKATQLATSCAIEHFTAIDGDPPFPRREEKAISYKLGRAGQQFLRDLQATLRALVMHLEGVSRDDIAELNIPTGAPRRYTFDAHLGVRSAEYLGDADAVARAAAAVAAQAGTA